MADVTQGASGNLSGVSQIGDRNMATVVQDNPTPN